jgi:uncharacterized protein (DUF2141 family)
MLIKRRVFTFIFFVFFGQILTAQLIIEITNIKEFKGRIDIGLYHNPENFLNDSIYFRIVIIPVEESIITTILDSIPAGTYSISLMQDLNEDGEMEHNFIGIPKEPYGFSTNFRPRFGKPDFEDAEFYYDGKYL